MAVSLHDNGELFDIHETHALAFLIKASMIYVTIAQILQLLLQHMSSDTDSTDAVVLSAKELAYQVEKQSHRDKFAQFCKAYADHGFARSTRFCTLRHAKVLPLRPSSSMVFVKSSSVSLQ